jgi:hypothetical protein
MTEERTEWVATYEEIFTTDTKVYYLPTMVLSEAARIIEADIAGTYRCLTQSAAVTQLAEYLTFN